MSWKSWIAALGGAMLLALAAWVYTLIPPGFSPERWKAEHANTTSKNPRISWVGQVQMLLHPGMTKNEVIALLGEPESKKGNRYTYDLGVSPYGIDYEYFNVEFDDAGKLTRFFLERG